MPNKQFAPTKYLSKILGELYKVDLKKEIVSATTNMEDFNCITLNSYVSNSDKFNVIGTEDGVVYEGTYNDRYIRIDISINKETVTIHMFNKDDSVYFIKQLEQITRKKNGNK